MDENKLLQALQSRKLWAAVIGLVMILWTAYQSGNTLDPDTVINAILGIVAAYIGATAWEDSQKARAAGEITASSMTANAPTTTTVSTPTDNVTVTTTDSPSPPHVLTADQALRERGGPAGMV